MVKINTDICTGCAKCVKDCFPHNIKMESKKAQVINENCMQCGHCVAVCPVNACEITDYNMADVVDFTEHKFTSDDILTFIKLRRSIRQFKDKSVDRNLIEQIINAGRYTATASNRQALSFIVVEKAMQEFRGIVIENLASQGRAILASDNLTSTLKGYAQRWVRMGDDYNINPNEKDSIFFDVPVVILIAGDSQIDAGLAASNMELVACANGLGVLYSGFITRGAGSEKAKKLVGVPAEKEVLIALLVGFPDVVYKRSAPRKAADIIWS